MANVVTTAETNLVTAEKMKRAREVDFVQQFTHQSLDKLTEIIGVTRQIPLADGTTMYVYKSQGELASGDVPEGEIIPLSKIERVKEPIGEIKLQKYRKAASAEAIRKSGADEAIVETDNELRREVQADIRTRLFNFLNGEIANSVTATGTGLQAALADAWGKLQVAYEDDTAEPVFFVNPLDLAAYLGTAQLTTQTAFGITYIQGFLGLGTVIASSRIKQGTFVATAKSNLDLYYIPTNGDLASAFALTTDETGLIGISSGNIDHQRATIETLVISGINIVPEYAEGVIKGTITAATTA